MVQNKKILVTGADGFIGSHLTEMLVRAGAKVRALSYYNSFNNWGWLEDIDHLNEVEVVTGDVRDPHFCMTLCKRIDIVFHLAALISIPYSYIAPSGYVETNVGGTLNICQAALMNGCERVIHTSTSEVYGTAQYVPIDEKHPLQPQSPYSASKIGADSIVLSFYDTFDLPATVARPFNTYGPRQSARAVIPTMITQILAGNKEVKLGDIRPTRDFNFVEDTCRAFIALANAQESVGEVVNIGTNTELSIGDLLDLIKKIMNSDARFEPEKRRIRPPKSEVLRLRCDNSKLKKLTGFKHEYDIEKGLEKTIDWFTNVENLHKYKSDLYNV
ncbi:MAG: GDP-mannose 4,6-dehydratase [Deltaproteobacteria bacterium]|nr:GDP-mannose 4,6-dehydratase [Deltaproteobacteria bacterium]MBW2018606.1 GDP-mannose 4,6-dehydratase [Deltaproteobacteria bacterium]MBW2073872.1 GDP-mannose 4,6-dehydratase [Deltaproteobacteria bacterium]